MKSEHYLFLGNIVNFRQNPQNTKVVVRFHGNDQLQGTCKRYAPA